MNLTDQQRRALTILDDMGPQGCLERVLLMHGFGAGVVSGSEVTARAGRRSVYVTKVRITDAGRRAIAG
jgi:hypothetical protein